ncbi:MULTISPECIES: phosphotransferase family protein [Halorussus]|uniref:phosphotransferase family protein n=1 Tax=Halorussus TaxID=1070314 RepID=UPI000E21AADC|nr:MULTISPECIES: phosphotransferase [Halorussus]NHN57759.1 phosphotransferase [Halorussus sp. JP-T4]
MDTDEALADRTLRRLLREVRPAWSLRGASAAEEGTDLVYFLDVETPEGPRECVLKAREFLDPEAFRPEPYLMTLADRRTSMSVPSVVGAVDDHPDLPAPFFLMERRAGDVRENGARDLHADAMERIARDAGRWLGELHGLGDFERFGPIRLARDVDPEAGGAAPDRADRIPGGIAVEGRTITVGEAGTDSWRDRIASMADDCLDDLHDRFADLEPDLRAFVDDRLDALPDGPGRDGPDGGVAPVLGHDDYRLGNLLVDPETGETRAVLDWGNAHTMTARYNLVVTEQYLSGWATRDDPLRERVRAALREGYRESGELPRGSDDERRRELYLAVTRTFPLGCFSLWYGDFPASEREAVAERNRRAVLDLVD